MNENTKMKNYFNGSSILFILLFHLLKYLLHACDVAIMRPSFITSRLSWIFAKNTDSPRKSAWQNFRKLQNGNKNVRWVNTVEWSNFKP